MAPFGRPVVPLVKCSRAGSSGPVGTSAGGVGGGVEQGAQVKCVRDGAGVEVVDQQDVLERGEFLA